MIYYIFYKTDEQNRNEIFERYNSGTRNAPAHYEKSMALLDAATDSNDAFSRVEIEGIGIRVTYDGEDVYYYLRIIEV